MTTYVSTVTGKLRTWLVRRDGDPGMEYMLSSFVTLVDGRGVFGSFTTASVTYRSAHPISASKNSRNDIWQMTK